MHRIERRELSAILTVAIKQLPKSSLTRLSSKLPVERDAATRAISEAVCDEIDNASTMVIRADLVDNIGNSGRPGVFGEDEPDPTALTIIKPYKLTGSNSAG
ncbi:MAG: hypothetical protein ABJP02_04815 [Parasphingorhabdus sp.]|uniref:hypothetical protein n=1 Tax=Parasphingorhabdus sp. TaxID=2709688 RepID=UPI003298EC19